GILLLTYYRQLRFAGRGHDDAILRAAEVRMRPRFMTALSACIGLLPAATSTAIGSQVQRPLAMVVVGGMLLVPILISWVLPVILSLLLPRGSGGAGPDPAALGVEPAT
ncbi:MAG TPA: efflux RND transporter permease subunit, partial [Candidatus Bathyarchaeia archaeon]|nr:efflux RND transporter permease subunit [Candidatus Bathyarchaeia archaeon]